MNFLDWIVIAGTSYDSVVKASTVNSFKNRLDREYGVAKVSIELNSSPDIHKYK